MVNVPCNTKYIPPLSSIQIFFGGVGFENFCWGGVQVHENSSLNPTQYIRQPWNSNFTQTRCTISFALILFASLNQFIENIK